MCGVIVFMERRIKLKAQNLVRGCNGTPSHACNKTCRYRIYCKKLGKLSTNAFVPGTMTIEQVGQRIEKCIELGIVTSEERVAGNTFNDRY